MTLTTFQTSHLGNGQLFNAIFFGQFVVNFGIIFIVFDLDVGFSMTIDTPTHAQSRILINNFHLFYRSVTCLALQPTNNNVLSVVLEGNIDQVQYTDRIKAIVEFLGPKLSLEELTNIWNLGEVNRENLQS